MSRLRFPLDHSLRDPLDEVTIRRMADEIDSHFPRQTKHSARSWVAGAAALLITLALVVLYQRRDHGPLQLADGRALATLDVTKHPSSFALSDGSRIELEPGAHLEPLENTSTRLVAMLARGSAQFDVHPGGPRRWIIECGLASVEVVGTRFSCERTPQQLRVAVSRGTVLVRGEHVPDRVRRLTAGEALSIVEPAPLTTASLQSGAPRTSAQVMPPEPASTVQPPSAAHFPTWRDFARSGHPAEAYAKLGSAGIENESKKVGVADLLILADVARLSGHAAEAVAPLHRIVQDFPADAQAPLAAFALGRLQLDAFGNAGAAAVALQRALELGIPNSLREDVLVRLVEAHARAGQRAAAAAAAEHYHREYPAGQHRASVSRWISKANAE